MVGARAAGGDGGRGGRVQSEGEGRREGSRRVKAVPSRAPHTGKQASGDERKGEGGRGETPRTAAGCWER